jgi:hypothetical protein
MFGALKTRVQESSASSTAARLALVAVVMSLSEGGHASQAVPPPKVTRAEMVEIAQKMAGHSWVCQAKNLKATCMTTPYKSRFKENQSVTGVAYDWGGMDDIKTFQANLDNAQAAGSHSEEGVSSCTTGVDCSGFISLCWRQSQKFGTATIGKIAPTLDKIDRYTELKPGDALNLPGSHIVMFARYNDDGTIAVYEASSSESRVVLTERSDWARFKPYVVIRYKGTVD